MEIGRGLAPVESGVGTLISFSTQPGNTAEDGSGRNSPFAGPLVKHITSSHDDLSGILIAVRNDVIDATKSKQIPWEHSALRGRFYFNVLAQTTGVVAPLAPLPQASEASLEWSRVDKASVAELETFLRRHGSSLEADYARARLNELKQQTKALEAAEAARKKADEEARAKAEADRRRVAVLQEQEEKERARAHAALVLPIPRSVSCADQARQRKGARTIFMTKCQACEKTSIDRNYAGVRKFFFVNSCVAELTGEPLDCSGLAGLFNLAGADLTSFLTKCEEARSRCEEVSLERKVEAKKKNAFLTGCIEGVIEGDLRVQ